MLEVQTEESFPTGRLADRWEALVASDPSASLFHGARFLRLWCRHLCHWDLRLRFLHDSGELIGVVPEVREVTSDGRRIVHFAGGYHVTDYLGPVSRPEHRSDVVDVWFDELEAERDWDELLAAGLADDAGWHQLIAERASGGGMSVNGPRREDVCPRIDLAGGWEGYLARLTSKQRHEIRRKARKLSREAGVAKLVAVDVHELSAAIDEFFTLNRAAGGEKSRFFVDDSMYAFFQSLAAEFGPERTLRVHRLDVEGRPGAISVSLTHGSEWGLYNSAFELELRPLAPGMVLLAELIRIAGEDGFGVFDLLRGDEPYKYRYGAEDRGVQRLVVAPA
ncbi:MAG: GNAT family N-acetyltransferase [Actinomycetota bacterium]|nr:GNAT family N-acetyltransferase [Actinomycetota bacterium]